MEAETLNVDYVKLYKVHLNFYMFEKSTPQFDFMENCNHNDPINYHYQNMPLYFCPIKKKGKLLFGIITYNECDCTKFYNHLVKSYTQRSIVRRNMYAQSSGILFNDFRYWCGWIPKSAFLTVVNITDSIPDVEVDISDHMCTAITDHIEVGCSVSGSGSSTPASAYCHAQVFVIPNKSETDYKFYIVFSASAESIIESIISNLQSKFRMNYADHCATFFSIADYPDVIDTLDKHNSDSSLIPITIATDHVPEDFDLDKFMSYEAIDFLEYDEDYDYKTIPFGYQEEAIEYGLKRNAFLLADSQGLGKTLESSTIAVVKKQHLGYKHCLIVCCVNTLKLNWENEIRKHTNEDAHILGAGIWKGRTTFNRKRKLTDLDKIDEMPYFLITNIEFLRDETAIKKLSALIEAGEINMIIADEVHKCKNPSAKQTKGLLKLQPECRIAMTGTPIMNSPLDVYAYLKWLGYEKHSFTLFKNYYTNSDGSMKNIGRLDKNMENFMLRRTKEEVLDLPGKNYLDQIIELKDTHIALYEAIVEETANDLANIDPDKINPLTMMQHLRECTLDPKLLSPTIADPYSNKFLHAKELIEECFANNESVLVFCTWKEPLKDFCRFLTVNGISAKMIHGEVSELERMQINNEFQESPETEVLCGTIGAMGTGLTLTKATTVIFLDEPWNDALKEQAVDRCYRIGTNSHVTIYTLICKDTIDERIHELINYKREVSSAIIDKEYEARYLLGLAGKLVDETAIAV